METEAKEKSQKNRESFWPNMPLMKILVQHFIREQGETLPFQNTTLWYVQHSFPTSLSVLDAFIALGARPEHIGVIDKAYSRCHGISEAIIDRKVAYQAGSLPCLLGGFKYSFIRDVSQALKTFIQNLPDKQRIIAVSHGQNFFELIPPEIIEKHPIVGIEKTTAGLMDANVEGLPFPVINMAGSATKLILESPIIADEFIEKLSPFIPKSNQSITCGIVGYGSIGKALAAKLLSIGHKVMVYERDFTKLANTKAKVIPELSALISYSDYIFGCTGQDIAKVIELFNFSNRNKTLISCSSGDVEFLSLLQFIQKKYNGKICKNPFDDIEYINEEGATIRILRGGFPINFDRISESSTPKKIQLTRALSLASTLQATKLLHDLKTMKKSGIIKLSPSMQKTIAQAFFKYQPEGYYSQEIMDNFKSEEWISANSAGMDQKI